MCAIPWASSRSVAEAVSWIRRFRLWHIIVFFSPFGSGCSSEVDTNAELSVPRSPICLQLTNPAGADLVLYDGEEKVVDIQLCNTSDSRITVLSRASSCGCTGFSEPGRVVAPVFPFELIAHERRDFVVRIRAARPRDVASVLSNATISVTAKSDENLWTTALPLRWRILCRHCVFPAQITFTADELQRGLTKFAVFGTHESVKTAISQISTEPAGILAIERSCMVTDVTDLAIPDGLRVIEVLKINVLNAPEKPQFLQVSLHLDKQNQPIVLPVHLDGLQRTPRVSPSVVRVKRLGADGTTRRILVSGEIAATVLEMECVDAPFRILEQRSLGRDRLVTLEFHGTGLAQSRSEFKAVLRSVENRDLQVVFHVRME